MIRVLENTYYRYLFTYRTNKEIGEKVMAKDDIL